MLFVADSAKEKITELVQNGGLDKEYFVRVSVTLTTPMPAGRVDVEKVLPFKTFG